MELDKTQKLINILIYWSQQAAKRYMGSVLEQAIKAALELDGVSTLDIDEAERQMKAAELNLMSHIKLLSTPDNS